MLRINVIGEARRARRRAAVRAPRIEIGSALRNAVLVVILLAAIGFIGWRWWSLNERSQELSREIVAAEAALAELQQYIRKREEFTAREDMLEARINLIEERRRSQRGPVQLLAEVSRNLPELVWLESMEETQGRVGLRGRALEFAAVSAFYNNLRDSSSFSDVVLGDVTEVDEGVAFRLSCVFVPLVPGDPARVGG